MNYQLPYDVKEKIEKNTIFRIITFFLLEVLVVAFIGTRKLSIFPSKLQLVFEKILGYFDGLVTGFFKVLIRFISSCFLD